LLSLISEAREWGSLPDRAIAWPDAFKRWELRLLPFGEGVHDTEHREINVIELEGCGVNLQIERVAILDS
jgi:hypothetical protein